MSSEARSNGMNLPIRLAAKASVERGCGETQPQKRLHCCGWCFAHGRAPSELATNRTGMVPTRVLGQRTNSRSICQGCFETGLALESKKAIK